MSTKTAASVLRLSITDRCNLRCRYCMPATGVPARSHSEMLRLEELARLTRWLAERTGICRIKLTGGEPLVRLGVEGLVRELATIPGIQEVSATTNAALLPKMADRLVAAGLSRVNISLDTMDPDRFDTLTRGGKLADTLAGLDAAVAAGLKPIKLNSVLLCDGWREDVPRLLDLAAERGLELRFIELMRTGTEAKWAAAQLVAVAAVRSWLGLSTAIGAVGTSGGPARVEAVRWRGATVRVGWITPQSHPFCGSCSRLRLDGFGNLRRCLMDAESMQLADIKRRDGDEHAAHRLADYMDGKRPPVAMTSELPMIAVGG
ncbi:MAG: radical SAM protein [bacterium]|nr:radical SAM protein [bacterium]